MKYKIKIILIICSIFTLLLIGNGILTSRNSPTDLDFEEGVMSLIQNQEERSPESQLTGIGEAIILRHSILNAYEFRKTQYLFPIPFKNRAINIIFGSKRTGSTFLGDFLSTVPATYYHFEPFNFLKFNEAEHTELTVKYLKNIIRCNFSSKEAEEHINFKKHWEFNHQLYSFCQTEQLNSLCRNITFREAFCNIFPRQLMKLVRARITMAEPLLADKELNVRALLLVRDPRAVYLSRQDFENCSLHPECYCMETYCKFLSEDYKNAALLQKKFPHKLKVLRFEDLANNTSGMAQELLSFFQLPHDEELDEFLASHTNHTFGGRFSTFRNTKDVLSNWMRHLNISVINEIQYVCADAMKVFGYKLVTDESQLTQSACNLLGNYVV